MATGTFPSYQGAVDITTEFLAHAAKAVDAQKRTPLQLQPLTPEGYVHRNVHIQGPQGYNKQFAVRVMNADGQASTWFYDRQADLLIPFFCSSIVCIVTSNAQAAQVDLSDGANQLSVMLLY